jgi:hypothetical protein
MPMSDQGTSRFARCNQALYRLLLMAYPARFRREYAVPMVQMLGDMAGDAKRSGRAGGLARLWGVILLDLAATIPAEHLAAIRPSRNVRGPALMLGGILFSSGLILSNGSPAVLPAASGLICLAASNLLLAIGLLGFLASYRERLGLAGRISLLIAALSSAIALAGGLGLATTGMDLLWGLRMLGLVALFLSLALFGLVCLVRKPLPRFNGIPLLISVWIPVGGLFAAFYNAATGSWPGGAGPLTTGILLGIGLGFLLLGNVLRTEPRLPINQPLDSIIQ